MSILPETLNGANADIYFHRTLEILAREDLDPIVTMEIFPTRPGLLCGMNEALDLLREGVRRELEIWALTEGVPIARKEVALRLRGHYRDFGIYETALLGILASQSGWATAAREVVQTADPIPVTSFGARHVHPNVSARMEYAAIVGGCVTGATPAGAGLAGLDPAGTTPHALILILGDTLRAARAFDEWMPPDVPRTILIDTFHDEADEAVRIALGLSDHLWGVRLDTPAELGGVTPALVTRVRAQLDLAGFPRIKIFVSGGFTPDKIARFKREQAPVDGYGVGSFISAAPPLDFTADLKEIDGNPIAKRGRTPGVTPNARLKKIQLS